MCLISEVLAPPSERSWLSLALRAHHSPLRLVEVPDNDKALRRSSKLSFWDDVRGGSSDVLNRPCFRSSLQILDPYERQNGVLRF
jgi:hypothetical protein